MDLFDLPETLSPRLVWMREHKVRVAQCPAHFVDEFNLPKWSAHSTELDPEGYGETEDEALLDFCRKTGLRLWNER